MHGADPNWGRIVSAAGYAGVPFDPGRRDAAAQRFPALSQRARRSSSTAAAVSKSIRDNRDTLVQLAFSEGTAGVRFWTADLTAEYVRLNADYHT